MPETTIRRLLRRISISTIVTVAAMVMTRLRHSPWNARRSEKPMNRIISVS